MQDITPLTLWTQHPMSRGGKMSGMWSWGNTSPLANEFCMNKCSFTKHCYAKRLVMVRPNVHKAYQRNAELLAKPLPESLLSWAPLGSHRIQAFGELLNDAHWRNCVILATLNPQAKFTIWTKRLDIIEKSIWVIPENLQVILSGDYLNNELKSTFYPTFLVSKEEPEIKHIKCIGKCINCQYCYGWSRHAGLDPRIPIWEKPR